MLSVAEKELVMPNQFIEVTNEEMEYVDGGIAVGTIVHIVTGVIAVSGSSYGAGRIAGERAYYAGLKNKTYQKWKWRIRAAVVSLSPVTGTAFMLGFENKFYSMIR